MSTAAVTVYRADSGFRTQTDWLDSRHTFSFGPHYDPDNTHFGVLLVSNNDLVQPGTGFDTHPHRDMEIVTWVLDGALVHQDSEGHHGLIVPGLAQRMSAGRGILHSERNDVVEAGTVHFVQMWVMPDDTGTDPGYEQREVGDLLGPGRGWVPVASGRGEAAIRIRQRDASFRVARMGAGESLVLPTAPFVHLLVASGALVLEGAGPLSAGASARLTGAEGQRITATEATEALVWEMWSTL